MTTLPILTSFLGSALLINIVILTVSTIAITAFKSNITKVHATLFKMKEEDLSPEYFRYLANYKLLIMVFNLAPWLALKLMAAG